jgi:hypothetical protein
VDDDGISANRKKMGKMSPLAPYCLLFIYKKRLCKQKMRLSAHKMEFWAVICGFYTFKNPQYFLNKAKTSIIENSFVMDVF